MASPQARSPCLQLGSAANSGGDEAIWKRLREAGFDDEMVKRRDKAALISYITMLESERYDYQHHMGLLILERKELLSNYEQLKASTETGELARKHDQAAQTSALAEAKKREESLRKALSIEKECVANIEKAMHDMCSMSAETTDAYERKLSEACAMMESAQKKFDDAERKLRAAESLRAEANRSRDSASFYLQEVEAREDELRRRLNSLNSECEAKEKEIQVQRHSLYDSQKNLHQEQERLLEGQTLLNQREEYIFEKSKELISFEKELEEVKAKLEEECRVLKKENSNLDILKHSLASREEDAIRKESLLDKKELELLVLQEKIASKGYDEIQRLKDEHQSALERKRIELELEIEQRLLSLEEDEAAKKVSSEAREADLNLKASLIQEKELALETELSLIAAKHADLLTRSNFLEDSEKNLHAAKRTMETEMLELKKERDEIKNMKLEIEGTFEDKKREIIHAQENLGLTMVERNNLILLETKLKEEIDDLRAQKEELMAEAEKLRSEKEKFELEWESIDEKREELQKEAERVAAEREAMSKYIKNEHESLKLERENLRHQLKKDAESLSREREEFMIDMKREYSDWSNKIQNDRKEFERDSCIQQKELENRIRERRAEVETYLRERDEALEQEKCKELDSMNSRKQMIAKDLEHVATEMKRLDYERAEIALDRERREREWSEIKCSIELLNVQREKLQQQRKLLHADREKISKEIQDLNELDYLKMESEIRALSEIQGHHLKVPAKQSFKNNGIAGNLDVRVGPEVMTPKSPCERAPNSSSPPVLSTISRFKKMISSRSPGVEIKSQKLLEGMKSPERGDVGESLSGKKRLSNYQDHSDVSFEPTRKHQKKTGGNGSADAEKTISYRMLSTEKPCSHDELGLLPSNPKDTSADCMDRDHNTPKLSNSTQPEMMSQPVVVLHTDFTEIGKSRRQDNTDKVINEAEEPPAETSEPDVCKLKDKDGDHEDNSDIVPDETVSKEEKS